MTKFIIKVKDSSYEFEVFRQDVGRYNHQITLTYRGQSFGNITAGDYSMKYATSLEIMEKINDWLEERGEI
jgi:hypothetical protein